MNQYETVFILTPVLSDDQMKEAESTGFYILMEFKAQPEVIKTLEVNFRRDEKVLRYLTVKQEKYAAEYAEKRRNNKTKKED